MICISYLIHAYKTELHLSKHENIKLAFLFIGLFVVGVGTVPNQSFMTLVLTRAFPNIEFNILLVVPLIITSILGPLANYIVIYSLKWGFFSICILWLIFSTWFAIYTSNDPKKSDIEI